MCEIELFAIDSIFTTKIYVAQFSLNKIHSNPILLLAATGSLYIFLSKNIKKLQTEVIFKSHEYLTNLFLFLAYSKKVRKTDTNKTKNQPYENIKNHSFSCLYCNSI